MRRNCFSRGVVVQQQRMWWGQVFHKCGEVALRMWSVVRAGSDLGMREAFS